MRFFAQRGTKVAVIDAPTPTHAQRRAAQLFRLRRFWDRNEGWCYRWPEGSVFREATAEEVRLWDAAQAQVAELAGLSKAEMRDRVRPPTAEDVPLF